MLTLTDSAVEMIVKLRSEAHADLGLRICQPPGAPGLRMSLEQDPAPDDVVLEDPRVGVFLDPVAAARLDRELLDARSNGHGSAFFLEPGHR